jgi:hypothetical protein
MSTERVYLSSVVQIVMSWPRKSLESARIICYIWHEGKTFRWMSGFIGFSDSVHRSVFLRFLRWDFGYCGHYWPIVPAPDDRLCWLWRNWWNEEWQGKPKFSGEKTCPSATLSTTNPTWLDPGLIPGRRGGKPATNRMSSVFKITQRLENRSTFPKRCVFF